MNNYVKSIRSMIGTKPLLICGASVIVIHDRNILLQKRKDNGCWSYHGGCLELGEYVEDAARRELLEETGLKAKSMKLYGVFSGPELHYVYPHGDEIYTVDTVYVCDDFEGELHADMVEVTELKWFPFNSLPENLSPPASGILREFVEKKKSESCEKPDKQKISGDVIEKSSALVNRSFTGVLGTVDGNGIPQLKAMIKTNAIGLKEFWFCSNTSSKRVVQIQNNPDASLYFHDEKTFEGLMLTGKAQISYNDAKRKQFWNDAMKKYYPLGPSDPEYALIKFTACKGNYYHNLSNMDFDL